MKQIPILMKDSLKKGGRDTCFLMKIVSKQTGVVYPFTSLDAALKFDDGEHDVWYVPQQSMYPQNMQFSADMEVDNTELHGWFDDVVEQAMNAGLLGSAEVTIYRVNYLHPEYGAELVSYGVVGRIEFTASTDSERKIEFKGLDHLLKTKKNKVYSLTCRNDFGDRRCGMPLLWESATVSEVFDQYFVFKVTGVARPDNWFNFGVVQFASGENALAELEIETWSADGWIKLSFVPPYPIAPGTLLRLRQDCDKRAVTCIAYGNIINMAAEHLTPVQDQSLMVPGAYIKSTNAL